MQFAVPKGRPKCPPLAITKAGLLAEGVRAGRIEATYVQLCRAVEAEPSLNNYPALAGLAKQMQRYLGAKPLWVRAVRHLSGPMSGCARSQRKKPGW